MTVEIEVSVAPTITTTKPGLRYVIVMKSPTPHDRRWSRLPVWYGVSNDVSPGADKEHQIGIEVEEARWDGLC